MFKIISLYVLQLPIYVNVFYFQNLKVYHKEKSIETVRGWIVHSKKNNLTFSKLNYGLHSIYDVLDKIFKNKRYIKVRAEIQYKRREHFLF